MSAPKNLDSLADLKNYLVFLREYGFREIPLETNLDIFPKSPEKPRSRAGENNAIAVPEKDRDVAARLKAIREELGDCTRCKLCKGRNTIVFGSGNPSARLVFVGEGPGADEDEQGLPFVGRAGQKLTEIIEKGMRLNRERDAYICNIVKCRPPGNRDPEADEIAACKPFLIKQLRAINPRVIVALGKPAASTLLGRPVAITKERGRWFEYEGIKLMLTLHPAYLLRAYTLENRRAVLSDMQQVLETLKK
jgi:DNA polymerase